LTRERLRDMITEAMDAYPAEARAVREELDNSVQFISHVLLGGIERHLGEPFSDDAGYEVGMDLVGMLTHSDSPASLVTGLASLVRDLEMGNYAYSSDEQLPVEEEEGQIEWTDEDADEE